MLRRAALPFGLLAVIYSLSFAAPTYAQLPQLSKRCSPPSTMLPLSVPTIADPSSQREDANDRSGRKVIIDDVIFDEPIHLSDSDVKKIIAEANDVEYTVNSRWTDQFAELGLRGAWQGRGYFRVKVAAEARSLGGDSGEGRFVVMAHIDEGLQYHLGDLRFVNARPGAVAAFSDSQLRAAFPLHEGELFDLSQVRKGLEELTKLYGSQGYIDFTATPETQVDDRLQRISLVMHLDEQKQFRVGNFDIVGLDPSLEARLRAAARPGEIFVGEAVSDFLKQNRPILPPDVTIEDLQERRDQSAGIVDLTFDFRPCPPIN